jgi:hypothetical protein
MDALRSSAAALLVFDEAAARSRDVDRHLLVARQTGKPLIPLRLQAVDEGLLRQELLDAQWIDASAPGAMAEISRRAADYEQARREQSGAAGAAVVAGPALAAGAAAAEGQGAGRHRIEVLQAGPAAGPEQVSHRPRIEVLPGGPAAVSETHAPAVAAPERKSLFRSPTALIALLALLVVAGAIWYTLSRGGGDGDVAARPAPERRAATEYSSEASAEDQALPEAEGAVPVPESEPAAPMAEPRTTAPAASAQGEAEPSSAVAAPAARPPATPAPAEDAAEPEAEPATGAAGAAATVRAFYAALGNGDGASAAQFVVPGKRQSGPLSGPALSRYYSSFRRPLRLRSVTPVDANTVRVAYDYVLGDGRLCQGQATVDVVQSGGKGLVSGIRTQGPC